MKARTTLLALLAVTPVAVGAQTAEWSVHPSGFVVGGLTQDERYQLSHMVGAMRLADGGVVIADHYARGLRAFSPSGELRGCPGSPLMT